MNATNPTGKTIDDEIQFARLRGADSLRMMRLAASQALQAVDDAIEVYEASEDLRRQAECLNLAMLRICNDLLPRLRLDTAADAQAALLVAAARETAP